VIFYSEKLTWAMTQTTDDSLENQEGPDLRKLLSTMDLESVLLQAGALRTQTPLWSSSRSRVPTSFSRCSRRHLRWRCLLEEEE